MAITTKEQIERIIKLKKQKYTHREIAYRVFGRSSKASTVHDVLKREYYVPCPEVKTVTKLPKVLVFDIETAPDIASIWSLWVNFVPLDMLEADWFILSWAAKWLHTPEDEVMYQDLRGKVKKRDDKSILKKIWKLLDEADVVITQNGKKFDAKKLNTRFILNGLGKPSPYKHIDTLQIAKKQFAFTSNKLEYMTERLCVKYKKLTHAEFPGYKLWDQCLKDNIKAWLEMEKYNKHDVLSLEELYLVLRSWDSYAPNFSLYNESEEHQCVVCSSTNLKKDGYAYTSLSKFQRYTCGDCGAHMRGRDNLNTKGKTKSTLMNVR